MNTKTDSWLIIPIAITVNDGIYKKIEYKIPSYVGVITGYYASVSPIYDDRFNASVSLVFNGDLTHPIYQKIDFKMPGSEMKGRVKVISLHEPIKPNSVLQGFIRNDGRMYVNTFNVKLYLSYKGHE